MTDAGDTPVGTVPGTVLALGGEECLFRPAGSASCHVITRQVLQALDLCSLLQPFDDQVAELTRSIPALEGRESEVRRVLGALMERGLIQPAERFLAPFRDQPDAGRRPLEDVVVRTTGGPALGRLLDSLLDNERRHGNHYRYWIVDDSNTTESAGRAADMVAALRSNGLECRFLDRAWQQDHVDRLVDGEGGAATRWFFEPRQNSGFTGGRAWNVALTLLAGKPFAMLDDDLVCAPRSEPDAHDRLAVVDEGWSIWFHRDGETAAASGEAQDLDPLARHGEYLGRTLGRTVSDLAPASGALSGLDGRRLAELTPGGAVVATIQGIYGDAASAHNFWLYTVTGASRERLWASRETYEQALRSRWITRLRPGHSLLSRPTFTPAGLDATRLLPPTTAAGRNEDFLFGALLERLFPEGRTLCFPWALGHFPDGVRRWDQGAHERPVTPNLARFMADSLLNTGDALVAATPEARLRLAADQLAGIAAESDRALAGRLDEYLLFARSDLIRQLQTRLAELPNAPVYWAADVRRIVETNGRALSAAQAPRLNGMPVGDAEALGWLRDRLTRFADGLRAWPGLWQRAVASDGPAD